MDIINPAVERIYGVLNSINYRVGYFSHAQNKCISLKDTTYKGAENNQILLTTDEMLSRKCVTCADIVEIERALFNQEGIENHSIWFSKYNLANDRVTDAYPHCCIVYRIGQFFYYFEHINTRFRYCEIKFTRLEDAIQYIYRINKYYLHECYSYAYVYNRFVPGMSLKDMVDKNVSKSNYYYFDNTTNEIQFTCNRG